MAGPGRDEPKPPQVSRSSANYKRQKNMEISFGVLLMDDIDRWKNVFTEHGFSCIELKKFYLILSGISVYRTGFY